MGNLLVPAASPGRGQSLAPLFSRNRRPRWNFGEVLLALLREWGGTISEERGVRWCAQFGWGWPLFIVATTRPNGMGRRRWRHGYGLLEAWPAVAIAWWSPGDALWL